MNKDLAHAYQSALIYACLDDFTVASALPKLFGGQNGDNRENWKIASVDFIYRNLASELVRVNPLQKVYSDLKPKALCKLLAADDLAHQTDGTISTLWNAIYFDGSAALEEIVSKHKLLGWSCLKALPNDSFLDEILDTYRRHGVDNYPPLF